MRILQVGKFYPIRGGVEKVMYDLMLGLSERGIQCDMLCASTEDHPAGDIRMNDFATLMVAGTQLKLAATMLSPGMVSRLRKIAKNYDIVHIHHPDPMACLALYLSGYRGKVVLHWHSDILKQKNLLKLYKPLQDWLIKRADLIVGTTPVYVQQSENLQDVQYKVDYIPIGIEPIQASAEHTETIRRLYGNKRIILSLGRLVAYKGYRYLIEAVQYLSDDYVVVIGGKGPLKEELEQLIAQLGLQDRVHLIGFVAEEDLPAYYKACDIFCLSSVVKTEAFAIVQLEAMSAAKPVVSTDIPGSGVSWVNLDEVSGKVVEVEQAGQLAKAIQKIAGDDEYYHRLSLGANRRYKELFTTENMVSKALKLYNKVLCLDT